VHHLTFHCRFNRTEFETAPARQPDRPANLAGAALRVCRQDRAAWAML
jgi:hypothetical protein